MFTDFKLVKRESWLGIPSLKIKKINYHPFTVIHHTATLKKDYKGIETIKFLNKMHMERGFSFLGYHFLISPEGEIFEGRKIFEEGAHTSKYNDAIGISLIGNFEIESFDKKELQSLLKILDFLKKKYSISRFTFHFLLSKRTVCGRKIFEKIVKEDSEKKIFYYPSDICYNNLSGLESLR